jgi:succinate dehydrogenase hydrophobic anchor subunit
LLLLLLLPLPLHAWQLLWDLSRDVAFISADRHLLILLLLLLLLLLHAWQLLWDLSRDVAFKRAVFLAVQGRTGPGCSVLVTDVPGLEWGTPLHRVRSYCCYNCAIDCVVAGLHQGVTCLLACWLQRCWSPTFLAWSGAHLFIG